LRRLADRFGGPLVEALPMSRSGDGGGLVEFGIDAQGELAGKVLVRINTILGAGFKEDPQGNLAFMAQAIDILGIESAPPFRPTTLPNI
jgi:hypothetical protein